MSTIQQPPGQQNTNRKILDSTFLTGPGEDIVDKTILQLSKLKAFTTLFGKVEFDPKKVQDNNRVVNYNRMDWPLRMLPTMNIYCSDGEAKSSDNGWISGTVSLVIYWQPNLRRSDLTDVPLAMKAALENFFASKYVSEMMDRHVSLRTEPTVAGLNEYGKQISWTPNVEGFLENTKVPVTILKVSYRLDLRAWYRALEQQGRTKDDPFQVTLDKLKGYEVGILGVDDSGDVQVVVPEDLNQNP